MPRDFFHGRHAGLLVPLFSIPSRDSWGIGEIADLPRLGEWLEDAGFSFVQLLPINEMADGQNSPYSAMSAMAIDPIFIAPAAVPDVQCPRRRGAAAADERAALDGARSAPRRRLRHGPGRQDVRAARRLRAFPPRRVGARHAAARQRLKLFIDARAGGSTTTRSSARCTRARGQRLAGVARRHPRPRSRRARAARAGARDGDPVLLVPAMARRRPVGPRRGKPARSACSATSRSWSAATAPTSGRGSRTSASTPRSARLPTRFPRRDRTGVSRRIAGTAIAAGGFRWLAARARRSAELYDGYRVDHLVGFFRTYVRETNGEAAFVPPDEPDQMAPRRARAQRAQRHRRARSSPKISA